MKPIWCKLNVQYDDLFLSFQKNTIYMHFCHFFENFFCARISLHYGALATKSLKSILKVSQKYLRYFLKNSIQILSQILSEKWYIQILSYLKVSGIWYLILYLRYKILPISAINQFFCSAIVCCHCCLESNYC